MLIDTATNVFMQSIQTPILTVSSEVLAIIFDPLTLTVISLIIAVYLYAKSSKKQGIFFASVIILTGILIKVLKEIFQIARPLNSIIQESGFSFPSGHATMAVVFFGLIVYLFSRKKSKQIKLTTTLTIILAIPLIAFTRIYLRVHWLTDVVAGLVLGVIILTLSIIVYKNNYFFK